MYKSCLLFVLHVLTTKIELSMLVQSLDIDLSNAAICRLSCSSAFMNLRPTEFPGFLFLENRRRGGGGGGRDGASQSIGNFNHPCSAVWVYPVLGTHTSSYRKLIHDGPSRYELRQEYSFLLLNKALILLCNFLYTINFTTLSFSVFFKVSLKYTVTFILA